MSIRRASYVACDVCGDPCEISTQGAKEARKYALDEGWRRVRVSGALRDICPRHDSESPEDLTSAVKEWMTP